MDDAIAMSVTRSEELLKDLLAEYDKSLLSKSVSARALHLTHEICERLRSILDRLAHRYWDLHIAASLSNEDREAATIYFPIADTQGGFDSTLGRWRWKTVRTDHQAIYVFLRNLQPFVNPINSWLAVLNDLAVQGKHIDLVPQTRTEERRTIVTGFGNSVSWGKGVTFGSGVSVMNAPIDPSTQRILPTPGVLERSETWITFTINGHGVNAAGFCRETLQNTRLIAIQMADRFGV